MFVYLVCHGIYNFWYSICFGLIFCTHCWRIFLIWNTYQSWLIKFWPLKIKAHKQNPPNNSGHPGDIEEKKNLHPSAYPLQWSVDRFSLIHIFWNFEKCPSNHFKKCVMKFPKSKNWDVHFFSFSSLVIRVYAFLTLSKCMWG